MIASSGTGRIGGQGGSSGASVVVAGVVVAGVVVAGVVVAGVVVAGVVVAGGGSKFF